MSGATTTPEPTPATAPAAEPVWAKPSVSIYALTIFLISLAIAYYSKDQASLSMMMGATIAMAQQVVNYWMGSSSGSARKTEMQGSVAPGTVTTVVAPPAPAGTATTSTTTSTAATPSGATGSAGATGATIP